MWFFKDDFDSNRLSQKEQSSRILDVRFFFFAWSNAKFFGFSFGGGGGSHSSSEEAILLYNLNLQLKIRWFLFHAVINQATYDKPYNFLVLNQTVFEFYVLKEE